MARQKTLLDFLLTYLLTYLLTHFVKFAVAPLGPVHFLSFEQQSGIHCLIICAIQLLTPNNLRRTRRRICSPDIRSVSALEMLRNRALQFDIYLLTYLLVGEGGD